MPTTSKDRAAAFFRDHAMVILIVGLAVVVSILRPNFISWPNLNNLAVNTAGRFLVALGVSGCLTDGWWA